MKKGGIVPGVSTRLPRARTGGVIYHAAACATHTKKTIHVRNIVVTRQPFIFPARAMVLCALLALPAVSQAASERSGVFKNLQGEVSVIRAGKSLPAASGGGLMEGDRVVTGAKGAASLILKDGTVLTVGPNSSVDLTHYIYDTTSQNGSVLVNLIQGTVRMVTGIMGKTNPELIKITTPTSVVGVRGTDFIVEATQ
jgi:hypothetical protein